jgi:hypothetical protein
LRQLSASNGQYQCSDDERGSGSSACSMQDGTASVHDVADAAARPPAAGLERKCTGHLRFVRGYAINERPGLAVDDKAWSAINATIRQDTSASEQGRLRAVVRAAVAKHGLAGQVAVDAPFRREKEPYGLGGGSEPRLDPFTRAGQLRGGFAAVLVGLAEEALAVDGVQWCPDDGGTRAGSACRPTPPARPAVSSTPSAAQATATARRRATTTPSPGGPSRWWRRADDRGRAAGLRNLGLANQGREHRDTRRAAVIVSPFRNVPRAAARPVPGCGRRSRSA